MALDTQRVEMKRTSTYAATTTITSKPARMMSNVSFVTLSDFNSKKRWSWAWVFMPVLGIALLDRVQAAETTDVPLKEDDITAGEWVFRIGAIVVLLLLSALFSGLTLGLMSLDLIGLEIVIGAGEAANATKLEKAQAEAARKITPIRKNGNLLLTTLLLGNVAVNAMVSILMADLTSGTVGFMVSTTVIVIFGEIAPQAICQRHALQVGAKSIPIVKVIIALMYILAKPISLCLDRLLGEEIGTIHTKRELNKMLEIYVRNHALDVETGHIMHGAINYKDKTVRSILTPVDQMYMLPVTKKLDFETVREIFTSGYSRIPVWGKDKNDVVGLLFVKDLIFIDPEDQTPILNFIHIFGRGVHKVWPDSKLGDVLKIFKMGKGHLALVYEVNNEGSSDPFYELVGVVTLEDIIEEILQDEILDEMDVTADAEKLNEAAKDNFDFGRLRLLDTRFTDRTLSKEEVKAVSAHLLSNYPQFKQKDKHGNIISESKFAELIANAPVLEYGKGSNEGVFELFTRGTPSTNCIVIMNGKVKISAGREGFASEAGAWSVLGADALISPEGLYIPDFTATAEEKLRCLCLSRINFQRAIYPISQSKRSRSSKNVAALMMGGGDLEPRQSLISPTQGVSLILEEEADDSTADARPSESSPQRDL